mgnify:CR=1 FL=1
MAKRRPSTNKVQSESNNPISAFVKPTQHIESILIEQYRCFAKLSIGPFKRVNLLSGKNNVGKSSFLEALFLLLGATNINLLLNINSFRGVEVYEGNPELIQEILWNHLFNNFSQSPKINIKGNLLNGKSISVSITPKQSNTAFASISGSASHNELIRSTDRVINALQLRYRDENGKSHDVEMKVDEKGISITPPKVVSPFQGIIIPARRRTLWKEIATRYGQLEISSTEFDLISALSVIEPRLTKLTTIVGASGPMLYGDIGIGKMLPLADMGDGLLSLMDKLLAITSVPHGIVLVDEIENGFHYSVLEKVWAILDLASQKYDVQIFATTHSMECIRSAHKVFSANSSYDFGFHRLEFGKETIESVDLSQETLNTTLESGWEIR